MDYVNIDKRVSSFSTQDTFNFFLVNNTQEPFSYDGVLGLGPPNNTATSSGNCYITNASGFTTKVVSLSLHMNSTLSYITFGGYNSTMYTTPL
jgi:hypothetical protein